MNSVEFTEQELKDLTVRLCELGESLDIPPERFTIMLLICGKNLADAAGLEVLSERRLDS